MKTNTRFNPLPRTVQNTSSGRTSQSRNSSQPGTSFKSVFENLKARSLSEAHGVQSDQKIDSQTIKKLSGVISRVMDSGHEIQAVLNRIEKGAQLTQSDCLSIQARMLNFNQDLTVVSKVIEQTVGSVKTILQTQV